MRAMRPHRAATFRGGGRKFLTIRETYNFGRVMSASQMITFESLDVGS